MIIQSTQPVSGSNIPRATGPMALVLFETTNAVSTKYVLVLCAGFAILGLILFFVNRHQKKKALEEGEFLERPSVIRSVLTAALDARSRVDIFLGSSRQPQIIVGRIEQVGSKNIFITLASSKLPKAIRTSTLHFYFQLGTANDKTFYNFTGSAPQFTSLEGRFGMEVLLPKALTNAQKRDFVRINPGPGMVEAMLVWKADSAPAPAPFPDTVQVLGPPHFSYRPPKSAQVALVDISGGGVLLRFSGERLKECQQNFSLGDTLYILLLLHDLDTDKIFFVWLKSQCCRTVDIAHSVNIDAGLQFTHWAVVEKPTSPITWSPVQRDGEVPCILAWTLRVQTFLTRKSR